MTANGGGKFVVFETNGNVGTLRIGGLFVGSWYFPGKAQKNLAQCISTAHQAALDAEWNAATEAAAKMLDLENVSRRVVGKIRALKRSK